MLLSLVAIAYWILILVALPASVGTIFISIPIAVIIFLGYRQIRKRKIGLPNRILGFMFAALLFPVGVALIGSAAYDTQSVVASDVSLAFLGLSFVFTIFAAITEKGRRLFVFGVGCAFMLWTFWAWFMAGMAIANSWL
jgi:hypothetical protein